MGVKLKKIRGKWYLVINYHGRRKTKAISASKEVAKQVRDKVAAKLALGDLSIFEQDKPTSPTLQEYAERWLATYIQVRRKKSTFQSYETQLRNHVIPYFGSSRLDNITSAQVEDFAASLATMKTNDGAPRLTKNSVMLALNVLRSLLGHARRHRVIESSPAAGLGETVQSSKPAREVIAMTRRESELFLAAVEQLFNFDTFCLFMVALRAGLRLGEIAGLRWGDLSFGESGEDAPYILCQRNLVLGEFGTPKSGKSRRVDMSRQLRAVLIDLRERRLLSAMQRGQMSIAGDLVFQSEDGQPIIKADIGPKFMEPALMKAGLRHFNFHSTRHTFASLLLSAGVSPAYVQRQLGHSNISITVRTYGHFIPGENADWINAADARATNANQAQTREYDETSEDAKTIVISGLSSTMNTAHAVRESY